jgi:hypothetical protein
MVQPSITPPGYMTFRLRLTNLTGTVIQYADQEATGSDGQSVILQVITTLAAGSTTIVSTGRANAQTFVAYGNTAPTTATRQIIVEDIGPA